MKTICTERRGDSETDMQQNIMIVNTMEFQWPKLRNEDNNIAI